MNRTAESERFIEGDLVTDQSGNAGTVVKCFNKKSREYFLSVRVKTGPGRGGWDKLYRYTPLLDHEGGALRTICLTCGRVFLAQPRRLADLGTTIPKQEHCRTCLPAGQRKEQAQYGAVQDPNVRDVLHRPWRLQERVTPVESQPVVQDTTPHPANCLCGERPECTPFGAPECLPHDGQGRR